MAPFLVVSDPESMAFRITAIATTFISVFAFFCSFFLRAEWGVKQIGLHEFEN